MTSNQQPSDVVTVSMTVNGRSTDGQAKARETLADYLRDELGLTGTKLGCEHGVCGACTILVDDKPARACLMLAGQGDGREVRTVEGLATGNRLNELQQSFRKHHGLQCGFCTAGFLMSATALLAENPNPSEGEVVDALSGNICRCTGYQTIVQAVLDVAGSNTPKEES
ncbi:4-hydroxybenzoyl-CoA reductase, gamma subunit [Rhodococcus opacus PD630]|uniref:(2Fe-2S)-binding protein n=1 Tax=Rhodococcus opacus TaxID=37919 RepID=UPI00029CB620|nr:(2Fe-2S)-binding protein [Rhodococcus opacus]AHK34667.1 Carbon monoxide dehydrogenase small chain [Rhodococcus opacus PD630]EHI39449.1 4-hydroxybenzoyl-CoA reductase, gamma subunit [Rhodococcus opacus PD630]UDG96784.1 (2Fe-2S)-binding protein [Rhodococcus opacus PD630]